MRDFSQIKIARSRISVKNRIVAFFCITCVIWLYFKYIKITHRLAQKTHFYNDHALMRDLIKCMIYLAICTICYTKCDIAPVQGPYIVKSHSEKYSGNPQNFIKKVPPNYY